MLQAFTFQVNESSHFFWTLYNCFSLIKSQNRIKATTTPKTNTCTSTFIAMTTKKVWTHAEHMHIYQRTANGFKLEGIDDPEDLFDFSADDLYSLFKSMRNLLVVIAMKVDVQVVNFWSCCCFYPVLRFMRGKKITQLQKIDY